MDRAYSPINSILEQAASIIRRSKEAAGTLKPTESYKRGQIEELISFANSNDLWIDFNHIPTIYLDKGGENEVFYDGAATIYKLNNRQQEFCAVLIQPHIQAEREATEDEIVEYMTALGFEMDYIDEFHNEEYEVFDALKR